MYAPPGGGCGGPSTLLPAAALLSVPGRTITPRQNGLRDAYGPLERCFRLHSACVRCGKSYAVTGAVYPAGLAFLHRFGHMSPQMLQVW